jgi:protein-S-isoprenylcysteine O-methyltransferase Ste14
MRILRQIVSILALPGLVAIVIPIVLVDAVGQPQATSWPFPWNLVSALLGLMFLALGLWLLAATIRLFANVGQGTLAPWDPPRKLVVRGVYCHVRNPMIGGVFCVLLGEALLIESAPILGWLMLFILLNLIYIPLYEEPALVRRFGDDYVYYRQCMPRWIPRRLPWNPETDDLNIKEQNHPS